MAGTPDPKPERRKRATRDEWDAITKAIGLRDGFSCLICHGHDCKGLPVTRHHVLPRSHGGDDIADNCVLLGGSGTTGCHGKIEARDPGASALLGELLPFAVRAYVEVREPGYLAKRYSAKPGQAIGNKREPRAEGGYGAADQAVSAKPCKRCNGTGKHTEHAKTSNVEAPAGKANVNVSIPVAERESGADALLSLVRECGSELGELGFDAKTPPYWVLSAVLADWLNSRTERKAA